ncbi:MAG: hypothetical protein QOE05_137 [Actinomycetota bacterium]|jgi:hypothetical protein|nr:hypothetical protein [Actinomycetota bacterium]
MSTEPHAELRALALWHTRRRAVDELLGPLLEYGPVAVERVAERLPQVQALVRDEQRAFAAFVEVVIEQQGSEAVVLEMFGRRSSEGPELLDG